MTQGAILERWRLVLGKYAADQIPFEGGSLKMMEMEEVLDYLYSREYGEEQEVREDRKGGSGASQLTVPHWLTKIKTLFPRNTVEIMERHALEKYQMTELLTDPEVLLLDEPTRGIDVGAKYEIYQLILNLAKEGKTVIMVSSEMPEILGMSDRIFVIRNGKIAAECAKEEATQELLGKHALG